MLDVVAAKKHASMVKMEVVPKFYSIYGGIFLKIMKKPICNRVLKATARIIST